VASVSAWEERDEIEEMLLERMAASMSVAGECCVTGGRLIDDRTITETGGGDKADARVEHVLYVECLVTVVREKERKIGGVGERTSVARRWYLCS